ncbi:glutathionylspermidine synthase family protein [Sediminibacterium roseum]|uniref:Glutathionylspermidine synthase family protein n=1 Tax=Sediminibacterium roseum TaxID=1978412 RepID=A0ABW9ZQT3_9BACT|nr:glutathionylspermidine synthase family protein [Sediminibacterium roseum]NCI49284.1 glutathionylspermidine synthase family protein [Sediminibacterium roseum]
MKRLTTTPRNQWQAEVEKLGFGFHTTNVPYWDETVYYEMEMSEILFIEKATAELWDLSLGAVQHVMDNNLYSKFGIPEWIIPQIEKSWSEDHPAIYGRFDLCYKNGELKMLEFNADTPTSLYEAGIVQWFWLQDFDKQKDQFNSIHEKMIAYWKYLKTYLNPGALYFTCLKETLEDLTNVEYIRDCAIQAGLETKLVFIDDIGWNDNTKEFVDLENQPIKNIFKLYPWEWLLKDDFGKNILQDSNRALWIEPAWKMILSNKAILPVMWELYPDCPYLLPAYFEENKLTNYVKKPILSREGANIDLVMKNISLQKTEGEYGAEGFIYQDLFTLPNFSGHYPVIGSWLIGQEPAGMGIREADNLVTDNKSRFVPHLIG